MVAKILANSVNLVDGVTITTADNTAQLTLISTDADATNGPNLRLKRDSSSPADDDVIGRVTFSGENDASEEINYVQILNRTSDVTDGEEDGAFVINVMDDGTLRERMGMDVVATVFNDAGQNVDFRVESEGNTHMLFVDAGANAILVAKTSSADATVGCELRESGQGTFTRSGGPGLNITRNTNDGELIKFIQDGSLEGNISVSGTTVTYAGFTGTHWSRLADNSKPTILRGTIMDSIDEMCDWYQAVADVEESTDDNGNLTPAHTVKESIALDGKSVGDAITFTSNGTEYTGTIVKEGDVKHTKSKVSDTADSKKVYGLFSNWDDADDGLDGDVNDMSIAQVGTYIIRVHKDVTVAAGDLLVSNGDGTAKLQDDDIIRSKTVAKVNSNIKIETYSDGSYTVPCTLHC